MSWLPKIYPRHIGPVVKSNTSFIALVHKPAAKECTGPQASLIIVSLHVPEAEGELTGHRNIVSLALHTGEQVQVRSLFVEIESLDLKAMNTGQE